MKLIITWLRKNGKCRSWTNADEYEHACMSLTIYTDAMKRLGKEWNCTLEEAAERIYQMLRKE